MRWYSTSSSCCRTYEPNLCWPMRDLCSLYKALVFLLMIQGVPSRFRWYATCGSTPQVDGEGGAFVTEDQGASWRRIFNGGPGQQQSKDFAKGQGYAIGLAVNPFRQGELMVTAGDRPPGHVCQMTHAQLTRSCLHPCVLCMQHLSTNLHRLQWTKQKW